MEVDAGPGGEYGGGEEEEFFSNISDFYGEDSINGTNNTLVLHALGGYSTLHIVISSIVLTFMMIVVVIGNMLVIIAIATEKSLKNLQNWFIASLAVADFFVGLLIMPFSLANELMGYWIFGSVWCSIHSAMDVLLCTSSIMNICLISLDRYWSITQAVDYLKKRTPARAAVMIGMVWVLSALISIPPLLGWKDKPRADLPLPTCQLSQEVGYVLYSALGSFYIPSCIMVFVYIRIYFAARARARRAVKKPPKEKKAQPLASIEEATLPGPATPTVKAAPPSAHTSTTSFSRKPPSSGPPTPDGRKTVGFTEPLSTTSTEEKPTIRVHSSSPPEAERESSTSDAQLEPPSSNGESGGAPTVSELNTRPVSNINVDIVIINEEKRGKGRGRASSSPTSEEEEVEDQRGLVPPKEKVEVSELESAISEFREVHQGKEKKQEKAAAAAGEKENSSKRGSKKGNKLHFLRVETPTIWRTSSSLSLNGDVHILGTLSRSCSRLQLEPDPVSDVEPSSSDSGAVSRCGVVKPLKLRLCQPFFGKSKGSSKARRDVLDMGKMPSPKEFQEVRDPEREKRRIARKKEKRATLILGLIMGSFILCWLPFFFLYILEPLCPSCDVAPWGFAIAFWLGYMNSALNPVIYTIFNKDFRRAFRRILFK